MELIKYHKKYNRREIDIMLSSTNDTIILHTDNIDRSSGKKVLIKLDENNLYRKRFDKPEIHIPQSGSQVIRGLNKSFPVTLYKRSPSVPHTLHDRIWTNSDFEEFKKYIDDDFNVIKKYCIDNNIKKIIFPIYGLLTENHCITIERTPTLYFYIIGKEAELLEINQQ